jgi:hypothetical protein
MSLHLALSRGDIILILAVALQATVMAYVKQPKWKAIILSLPIPFTFMTLASGRPVDVTTIAGAVLFFFFMQAVRLLHYRVHLPIIPAIVAGALGYCLVGGALAAVLPRTAPAYWIVAIGAFSFGTVMFRVLPYRAEPGQRSYLPVWVKFPIITLIIVFLVGSRGLLQGFATVFPVMGTLTCYEARRSLWTMGRQAALVCLLLAVALSASYITEPIIGLAPSLVVAWIAWTAAFVPITRYQWSHVPAALPANPATS